MEESVPPKPDQNFVTCIYEAKIAGFCRNVTVTWSKNLINHILSIHVESLSAENPYTCKIDLKPWQFWGKKGLKSFRVDDKRVDVFWDLRTAKFWGSCPEPLGLLRGGDLKKDALKRTKCRPSLVDAVMVYKKECLFGKKNFSTRTKLGQEGKYKEHEVLIETSLSGPCDPEMMISMDGNVVIRVKNLHWGFRGSESVLVGDVPLMIFWDVHDWMYTGPNSGQGFFIFRPGEPESVVQDRKEDDIMGGEEVWEEKSEFCHLLCAWKIE
ncbi:hypothetical protein NMG60_11037443 [Bertholletia excelsa]